MIVFIILRSDDGGCLLIRATIDADIATGDVSRSGGTGEGNLVFSPAISDVERKDGSTSYLNSSFKHGVVRARQLLNLHADGERGVTLRLEAKLIAASSTQKYTKGTVLFVYFSWRFADFSLSLHHQLKYYAKKSKRKEWYGHLSCYAQGYQSSRYL